MNDTIAILENEKREKLFKTWQLFLLSTVISILVSFAFQKLIMTQEVYYSLYGSQLEEYRINDVINMTQKLQIWGILATPVLVWSRIAFVAFLIQLPFMLKFMEIPFKEIFRIVTIALFVLLFSDVTRLVYLYCQPIENITMDSLTFTPLAITNFLDKNNYSDIAFAFLSRINLFELFWVIVIYIGLIRTKKLEKIDYALIVFVVWVGIVMLTFGLALFLSSFS